MSVALYRKYRPGTFAEVRGQEHVTEPLQQALRNGRVHHAYLFSGPRGCGKTSSARILARSLNCVQGPTPEPCGECEPCVALAPTGPGSIDVMEIDAASHGGVDDARELRERAFFAPAASRYKVYVIDEAHMVTREGFNALLKLVEEPPPHLKFVFATTEPDKVIGTIRSRTHHYPFRLLPPSLLRDLLAEMCEREGIEVEPAALPLVVRAGAGSARDALSILDQILGGAEAGKVTYAQAVGLLGYTDASLLDEVVEAFAAGDGAAVFEAVNRVVEGGHDPRRFATDLLERFRDLVVLRSVPDAGTKGLLDQPPDQLERMSTQAGRMGAAELSRAADLFHEGLTEMRGATSPRLLLELVCARVLLPGASGDEASLLARLDRVERRMSIGEVKAPPAGERAHASEESGSHDPHPEADRPQSPGATEPASTSELARAAEPAGATEPASTSEPAHTSEPARTSEPPRAKADPPAEGTASEPEPAPAPGALDVAAIRRVWPDVLEDVKNRRRVAWMILLGDVQVASVDDRSLTLAFAKEGDRKGFTSSGCDTVLQAALQHVLGAHWEIRTTAGPADAGGSTQPPPPRDSGPPRGQARNSGAQRGQAPDQADPEEDQAPVPDEAPGGTGERSEADPPDAEAEPTDAVTGPTNAVADPTETDGPFETAAPPPGEPLAREGSRAGGTARNGQRAAHGGSRAGRPGGTDANPATETGAGNPTLSGMALIQRELGGEIIEEIEDS